MIAQLVANEELWCVTQNFLLSNLKLLKIQIYVKQYLYYIQRN